MVFAFAALRGEDEGVVALNGVLTYWFRYLNKETGQDNVSLEGWAAVPL